jgi:hypothetical protein
MLDINILSFTLFYCFAECHNAESLYAEYLYAECRSLFIVMLKSLCLVS